ncbi:putative colanic acid biosynthesis acetyltransferase [Altererythrobacter buctensis]|uniref:Putative colanic acid biosynthesis acetyltransferase n=2 Tax=Alteraurantiacibacter buctensis TaxID=1503981 RepID=A0A844YX70_9SPHN|nr:putative colanic acid biosynthesis acetyltransferase [Alteraurantiacibacter buctensis]
MQDPPGLANKIARGLWGLVWLLLYRPSPRPLHAWRRLLLRLFGAKVGKGALAYPSAVIWAPWNLSLGPGSTLGDGVDCYNVAHVRLGAGAVASQRAYLCTASRNIDAPGKPLMTAPIVLADHSWVAAEAYLAPGVTVGEGAVAAARAVVTRSIAPWSVVAGNPARVIRRRQGAD